MANILPFIRFKPLENIECVGFPAIVGCVTNIETIKPDIDEDFENDESELACQLEDGRWIIITWDHGDDSSTAYPAYYSILWNCPVTISTTNIEYELERIASGNVDSIKKQVKQWMQHMTDERYQYLVDELSRVINGDASNG